MASVRPPGFIDAGVAGNRLMADYGVSESESRKQHGSLFWDRKALDGPLS